MKTLYAHVEFGKVTLKEKEAPAKAAPKAKEPEEKKSEKEEVR